MANRATLGRSRSQGLGTSQSESSGLDGDYPVWAIETKQRRCAPCRPRLADGVLVFRSLTVTIALLLGAAACSSTATISAAPGPVVAEESVPSSQQSAEPAVAELPTATPTPAAEVPTPSPVPTASPRPTPTPVWFNTSICGLLASAAPDQVWQYYLPVEVEVARVDHCPNAIVPARIAENSFRPDAPTDNFEEARAAATAIAAPTPRPTPTTQAAAAGPTPSPSPTPGAEFCPHPSQLIDGGCFILYGNPELVDDTYRACPDQAPFAFNEHCYAEAGRPGFANCDAALAAGRVDIPSWSPNYRTHLDADGDGVACESS